MTVRLWAVNLRIHWMMMHPHPIPGRVLRRDSVRVRQLGFKGEAH